jgi:DSF synthase
MLGLGVVDIVTDDGTGEDEVNALIKRRSRSRNGLAALAAARRRVHGITFEELMDVVQIWVDSALHLNVRDLKLMHRLVSRQNGLGDAPQVH